MCLLCLKAIHRLSNRRVDPSEEVVSRFTNRPGSCLFRSSKTPVRNHRSSALHIVEEVHTVSRLARRSRLNQVQRNSIVVQLKIVTATDAGQIQILAIPTDYHLRICYAIDGRA